MPNYRHYGLYFTVDQVQRAQKNRDREPFKTAWALLDHPDKPPASSDILWDALHYRLNNQNHAGEESITALQSGFSLDAGQTRFDRLASVVMLAHTYELVRDHPAFSVDAQDEWRTRFAHRVDELTSETVSDVGSSGERFLEHVWLGLMQIAAGIALEEDSRFEAGAAIYREIIDQHVRPEGYVPHAVEEADEGSLERQLLAVAALVLMAEAAKRVDVDLWNYTSRSISVITAASYCIYYYYYPEQWRWGTMSEAQAKATCKTYGCFYEIVNAHHPLKDLKLMLKEMRPLYNPILGGLTTLTHAPPPKRGLFG
jgi:Alginate lyase